MNGEALKGLAKRASSRKNLAWHPEREGLTPTTPKREPQKHPRDQTDARRSRKPIRQTAKARLATGRGSRKRDLLAMKREPLLFIWENQMPTAPRIVRDKERQPPPKATKSKEETQAWTVTPWLAGP